MELIYPFYQEDHLRRGRTVLRPVVRVSIGDRNIIIDALVDSGSEHVLADSTLAIAAGISLDDPLDHEDIGIGGGFVQARFVEVTAYLHVPGSPMSDAIPWTLDVGFFDRFTVSLGRLSPTTAIESAEAFDDRFGTGWQITSHSPALTPSEGLLAE